jgi:hypothetical protein
LLHLVSLSACPKFRVLSDVFLSLLKIGCFSSHVDPQHVPFFTFHHSALTLSLKKDKECKPPPAFLCLIFYYVFMAIFCFCIEQSLLKTNDNRISDDTYSSTHKTRIQNIVLPMDLLLSLHVHTEHRRG